MVKTHPVGGVELKKRRNYLNLSGQQDLEWAQAVTSAPEFRAALANRSHCPHCNYEFSCHQINKARCTGTIRCPRCGVSSKIKDIEVRK